MRIRPLLSITLLVVLLTLLASPGVAAPALQTPEPPAESSKGYPADLQPEESPFDLKQAVSRSMSTVAPQGPKINVAVTNDDESDPAVALCAYDQYLVVYVLDHEIYGQRLTSEGDLLGGAFLISGDQYQDSEPDVACDWLFNRFVVV